MRTKPTAPCAIQGCRNLSATLRPGPCRTHYDRYRRKGAYGGPINHDLWSPEQVARRQESFRNTAAARKSASPAPVFPSCEVEGCRHLSRTLQRGLCGAHDHRLRTTGTYGGRLRIRNTGTQMERIFARAVIITGPLPTPCVIVDAADGYEGRWRPQSRDDQRTAYRVMWEHYEGPVIEETLDHLCCVPSCVAVDHLEPVSNSENVRRLHERARFGAAGWLAAR